MKAKHKKTLDSVFAKPTSGNVVFEDLEALIIALGGAVREGKGSRVTFELTGKRIHTHRPHPAKEAKRYQVDEVRELLRSAGIEPA